MIKKFIFLIIIFLISFTYISEASLDNLKITLATQEYGPNQNFNGLLNLSFDELNADTLLNAYIDDNKITSETLENLLTNADIDFEKTKVIYEKTSSAKNTYTHTFQGQSSFLIGVELRDNVDPERKTSLDLTGSASGSSYPSDIKIDIGNDNTDEWQYSGNQIAWTSNLYPIGFIGNEPYEGEVIVDDLSLFKCQNLDLNLNEQLEKISFKINVLARRNPAKPLTEGNLAAFINLPSGELAECDLPEPNQNNQFNYNELYCVVEVEKPEDGNYEICVESNQAGEETYFIPYVNKNDIDFYYTGLQQSIYNYELKELTKFSGDRFIDALNDYYDSCDETTCLVPIKISSNKKGKINLNNLEITDIQGRVIRTFFNINSLGAKIKLDNSIEVPLTAFTNLKTLKPSNYEDANFQYEDYELKITSLDKEDIVKFNITLVPIAVPSASKNIIAVGQSLSFLDYSYSQKNISIVKWNWDFGDNTNSNIKDPTHSYSTAGEYIVKLTVEDANSLISNVATLKITVGNLQDLLPGLVNETLEDIEQALDYKDSASVVIKNIYTLLYPNILETSKSDLTQLSARLDLATTQQEYESIFDNLENITQRTPKTINIGKSTNFNFFLKNVNDVLDPSGFNVNADKQDIFKFNKDKVDINAEVTSINTLLLSDELSNIVLVKKHVNIDSSGNLIVVEDLGNAADVNEINILTTGSQTDTLNNVIRLPLTTNYVDLVYTVENGDVDLLSNVNTIIYVDIQSTIGITDEIECGDNICTIPNEDEVNCPEDCKRKRPIGISILIAIILMLGVYYFNFYHGPGEFRSLKIGKEKPLFKNKRDELVLVNYIQQSINKGFSKDAVKKVLLKKGWDKKQVEFALKESIPKTAKKVSFKYK